MISIINAINNFMIEHGIIMEFIFLLLILVCFIISFIYNKKDIFIWKFVKSIMHSICATVITFIIASTLLGSTYHTYYLFDIGTKDYSNLFSIINFFGYISINIVPIVYIIILIIIIKYGNKIKRQTKNNS